MGQFNTIEKGADIVSISGHSSGLPVSKNNHRVFVLDINGLVSEGQLIITWGFSKNLHSPDTIKRLADDYLIALQEIIEHCIQPDSGGFTPSDFSLCEFSQHELDDYVLADIEHDTIESIYPLSPMQEGMLFYSLYSPQSEMYMTQLSVDLFEM